MAWFLMYNASGAIVTAVQLTGPANTPANLVANTPGGTTALAVADGTPAIFKQMAYKVSGGQIVSST